MPADSAILNLYLETEILRYLKVAFPHGFLEKNFLIKDADRAVLETSPIMLVIQFYR